MRETADFDVADFANPDDGKGLYIRFFNHPVQDAVASAAEGRPIFVESPHIEIRAPGNQANVVVRSVRDADKFKFRDAWKRFEAGESEAISGTPLTELSWLTRSQVEELKYIGVRTVEHLADLSDNIALGKSGFLALKSKAKAWLDKAASEAPFTELHKENEDLKARLAALEAQVSGASAKAKAR